MPDISFDSLIIVLLVLASLFGRLFKKNKNDEGAPPPPRQPAAPPEPDEEEAPQLRDVLRDFWEKNREVGEQEHQRFQQSIEPIPEESVVTPPPPIVTLQAPSPDHKTQNSPKRSDQVAYRQK